VDLNNVNKIRVIVLYDKKFKFVFLNINKILNQESAFI
jgi:hypothetical protein